MELVLMNGYIVSITRLQSEDSYIYKFDIAGPATPCKFVLTDLSQLQEALASKCQDQFLSMTAPSLASTITTYIQKWDYYLEQKRLKELIPQIKKGVKVPKYEVKESKDALYIIPEDRSWVAVVKRMPGKGLMLSIGVIDKAKNVIDEILRPTPIKTPQDIEQLDIDDSIKVAVIDALAKWDADKQRRIQEYLAALGDVPVIPKNITDRDLLIEYIARAFVNRFGATAVYYEISGDTHFAGIQCYEDGVYRKCEARLKTLLRKILTESQAMKVTKRLWEEVIDRISTISSVVRSPESLRPIIAFKNGLFDWERFLESGSIEYALRPFDRSIYAEHKIPHKLNIEIIKKARQGLEKYIPPRNCEELVTLLKALSPRAYELLASWASYPGIQEDLLKSRICFLLQFIGRMLFPGYRAFGTIAFKDFFVFLGPPNAGKSTFVFDFVGDAILGRENRQSVQLPALADDPENVRRVFFKFYNKLMVVIEMDVARDVKSTYAMRDFTRALSYIISVSGGDPVEARKLREDMFEYYPAYKFVMISNEPPPIAVEGEGKRAFLVRAKIMEFKNRFKTSKDFRLNLSEEDIETIIILSIYGLRLVWLNDGEYAYTGIKDPEDAWLRYSDPRYALLVYALEKGYIALDPHGFVDRDKLVAVLREAAKEYLAERDPYLDDSELEAEASKLVPASQGGGFTKTYAPLLAKLGVEYDRSTGRFKGIRIGRKEEKDLVSYAGNS
jgi:hypothetical protein